MGNFIFLLSLLISANAFGNESLSGYKWFGPDRDHARVLCSYVRPDNTIRCSTTVIESDSRVSTVTERAQVDSSGGFKVAGSTNTGPVTAFSTVVGQVNTNGPVTSVKVKSFEQTTQLLGLTIDHKTYSDIYFDLETFQPSTISSSYETQEECLDKRNVFWQNLAFNQCLFNGYSNGIAVYDNKCSWSAATSKYILSGAVRCDW